MALYDPLERNSILVRQRNDRWQVRERVIKESDPKESFYTVVSENLHIKMRTAQIWEEEENEFCLGMKVLEPKELLFAGFEKDEE